LNSLELQANGRHVFGKRPFQKAFGNKIVEATLFQTSSFQRFLFSKAFGGVAWPWCQISSFKGSLIFKWFIATFVQLMLFTKLRQKLNCNAGEG
jgi:hypothetical protein